MGRAIAIDWSGRATGAEKFIWLAECVDGRLVTLENGRSRAEVIRHVITVAAGHPDTVVGLDFAFSFPAWWCVEQGWASGPDVWAAMAERGEALLAECAPPLWGRPGHPNPNPESRRWRVTERRDAPGAKSVFQIGGSGAVGTGSIRGMPHLLTLAAAGFDIWPFGSGGVPRVLEIYPRLLTGPVIKRRQEARIALLTACYADQPAQLLDRAAASEDAFDAAVSALEMDRRVSEIVALAPGGATEIEGRVWRPQSGD